MKKVYLDYIDIGCIADYVEPKSAASSDTFHSNFNPGFGAAYYENGRCLSSRQWVHLARQSIPLSYPPSRIIVDQQASIVEAGVSQHDAWFGSASYHFRFKPVTALPSDFEIPFFKLDMLITPGHVLRVLLKKSEFVLMLVYHLRDASGEHVRRRMVATRPFNEWGTVELQLDEAGTLTYLGLFGSTNADCDFSIGAISVFPSERLSAIVELDTLVQAGSVLDWHNSLARLQNAYSAHIYRKDEFLGVSFNGYFELDNIVDPADVRVSVFDIKDDYIATIRSR